MNMPECQLSTFTLADWTCFLCHYASVRTMMTALQSPRGKAGLLGFTKQCGAEREQVLSQEQGKHILTQCVCSTIFLLLISKNKHIHHKPNSTQNCIFYKKLMINELMYIPTTGCNRENT